MFSSRHLEFLHLYIFYKCTYTDVWVLGNNGNFMIGTYIHPFIIFNWINIVQIVQTQMEFLLQKYFSTFLYFEVKLEFYQSCTYQQNEQNKFGGIISHGRRDKVLYYTNLHLAWNIQLLVLSLKRSTQLHFATKLNGTLWHNLITSIEPGNSAFIRPIPFH